MPLLGGSFFRPLLGILGDRIGGRRAGLIGLALTLVPLVLGWKFAHDLWHFYAIGLLLGVAGASFAVALPLASRWYPPEHQGLAMGIAGAGNSGSLLATLAAPRLARALRLGDDVRPDDHAGAARDGRVRAARQGQPAASARGRRGGTTPAC